MKTRKEQKVDSYYVASQWRLMWLKLKKHKLAIFSAVVLACLYFVAIFCEMISPFTPNERFPEYTSCPPNAIRLFNTDNGFRLSPYVVGLERERDPKTLRYIYVPNEDRKYPVSLFSRGSTYKFWGIFETDVHLFASEGGAPLHFGQLRVRSRRGEHLQHLVDAEDLREQPRSRGVVRAVDEVERHPGATEARELGANRLVAAQVASAIETQQHRCDLEQRVRSGVEAARFHIDDHG